MSYLVFDTETTSLDRPFCYDVGYKILDNNGTELTRKHYIVEQVWHNLPLFESAYYKDKRPLYVQLMRTHKATMDKWGYVMQVMARDIKRYGVTDAYAYNSDFDDKVFAFNCDWFKCINPFDNIPVHDIWGYASAFITGSDSYKAFCEEHEYFTDSGNYKASAEIVYRYISDDLAFDEAHMGAFDVDIETEILQYCFAHGAEMGKDYKVIKILARPHLTPYVIKVNGKIIHEGQYVKKYVRKDTYSFTELEEQ